MRHLGSDHCRLSGGFGRIRQEPLSGSPGRRPQKAVLISNQRGTVYARFAAKPQGLGRVVAKTLYINVRE